MCRFSQGDGILLVRTMQDGQLPEAVRGTVRAYSCMHILSGLAADMHAIASLAQYLFI